MIYFPLLKRVPTLSGICCATLQAFTSTFWSPRMLIQKMIFLRVNRIHITIRVYLTSTTCELLLPAKVSTSSRWKTR